MQDQTTVFVNARLSGIGLTDIVVCDGKIASIGKSPDKTGAVVIDVENKLVLPGLVDGHMHLDKTLFGLPWAPHSAGPTRISRIETDVSVLPNLTLPAKHRAGLLLNRCVANGTAHIRTHVDVRAEMGLSPLNEILAVREEYKDRVSIEIVAFPQAGVIRSPGVVDLLEAAIDAGADLVGGIDPSVIDRDPRGQLDAIFGLADRKGVGIDIHLHEPGELGLFSLEEICERTKILGLEGRVTISHAFCLGMIEESATRKAATLLGEAGVSIATHGAAGMIIPPVLILRENGVTIFAGNDDVRDTWSPYGNADMLERATVIGWKSDFRRDEHVSIAFDIVSSLGAKALSIKDYGIAVGNPANFFTVDASCVPEAVGGHPPRRLVVFGGRVVAQDGNVV